MKKTFKISVADEKGTISELEVQMDPGKIGGVIRYIHAYFDEEESDEDEDYCALHQGPTSECSCDE